MVDELDEKKITVRWWVLFNMFVQRRPNSVQFGLESYCEGQSTCLFISFFQSSDHSGSGQKHLSLFLHSFHSGFFSPITSDPSKGSAKSYNIICKNTW